MTDRATVFETTQIGVESVAGTQVPALKKMLSTGIRMTPKAPVKMVKPLGSKAAVGALPLKQHSEGTIEGDASYTDLLYLFAGLFGTPTTTTPAGATNARLHSWIPKTFKPDEPKTFTVEKGSAISGAERAVNVVINGLALAFGLEGVEVSGDVFGKAMAHDIQMSTNEQQTITLDADSGTFTISFGGQTTAALAWNAAASVVQAALEGLSTIGSGNVAVTKDGLVYTVEFRGDLAQQNVAQVTTGVGNINEQQTVTIEDATGGTFTLSYNAEATGNLAYDISAANMQTALEGISGIGAGNVAVALAAGVYTVTFQGALAGTDCQELVADDALLTGEGAAATVATTVPGVAPTLLSGTDPGTATVATTVPGVAPTELTCVPISPVNVSVYVAATQATLGDAGTKLLNLDEVVWGISDRFTRRGVIDAAESSFKSAVEKGFTFGCNIDVGKDDQSAALMANLLAADTRWLRIACVEDTLVETGQPYSLTIDFPFKLMDITDGEKDDVEVSNFPLEPIHDSTLGGCMEIKLVNGLATL